MRRIGFQVVFVLLAGMTVASYQACSSGFEAKKFELSSTLIRNSISPEDYLSAKVLYEAKCASCHYPLEISSIKNKTRAQIQGALKTQPLMAPLASTVSPDDMTRLAIILSSATQVTGPNSCDASIPDFAGLQRLNNLEYNNVMRDLTGLNIKPADSFPRDARGQVFSNTAMAQTVDTNLGQAYFDTAIRVLDTVFANARQNIVTCDPDAALGHRACAEKIVREFGMKAFRRPLLPAEVTQFMERYDATRMIFPQGVAASQFDESLKASLQTILISPEFLFRIMDRATPGTSRDLGPYELASRLSFFIWGSIPDATLLNLAANRTILDKTVLAQQVDRMLKDPKAVHMVDGFAMQWLGLDSIDETVKSTTTYPEFTESLKASMVTESRMLLADIIQKDASPYLALNANYSYMNAELASHYGLPAPQTPFARVDLTSTTRRGVFGHGSMLSAYALETESSIVKRGLYVLGTYLCMNPGSPPPPKPGDRPPAESLEGLNPRDRLEAHRKNPDCARCHVQIDPPGFALENFDGVGKYRTNYSDGDAIDSHGRFINNEPMSSPGEIAQAVEDSPLFKTCFARNIMTYALGRDLTNTDKCAADKLGALGVAKTRKFSDIVKEVVMSPQFLKQKGSD